MDKMYRLRSNMEFQKVYNKGKNYWNRNLILFVKKTIWVILESVIQLRKKSEIV